MSKFPKQNKSQKIGRKGIRILSDIVEEQLNWLLRPNHQEDDYGIDAYVDILLDQNHISGKSIAIQAKTGSSYFVQKNDFGWKFYGELKHLNYYLNHDIPVLIVIVDETSKKAYWSICDAKEVTRTDKSWYVLVPFEQELYAESKEDLLKLVSPVSDYVSQLEHYWEANKMLKSFGRINFIAGLEDVLNHNYQPLIEGLRRLSDNKDLLFTHKENIEIGIHGYDNDPRELYEIPEVRKWIAEISNNVKGLSFFLSKDQFSHFLKLMLFCNVKVIEIPGSKYFENGFLRKKVEFDPKEMKVVLDNLFLDLNEFCSINKIPIKVNEEISRNIINYFTNGEYSNQENNKA